MNWVRVKSRMLAAVAYDRDWHHLYLEFRSGDIYCYRGVPAERYEELLAAESKGQYCRQHIRQYFPLIGFRERFAARADLYFSEK